MKSDDSSASTPAPVPDPSRDKARPRIPKPLIPGPPEPAGKSIPLVLKAIEREAAGYDADAPPAMLVASCSQPAAPRPVVTIAILEAPNLAVLLTGAPPTLAAVNRNPAAGGVLQWSYPNPQGVLGLPPVTNGNLFTPSALLQAGIETVDVTHSFAGQTVHAPQTVAVAVVNVTLNPSPEGSLLLHNRGAAANSLTITATGRPAGGVYAWRISNRTIVDFPGGVNPGNQASIQVLSVAGGSTHVSVDYTYGTVTASETSTIDVVSVRIQQHPQILQAVRMVRQQVPLQAIVTPPGGTLTWAISDRTVFNYLGGNDPGGATSITLENLAAGQVTVTASYTASGQNATDTVDLIFVGVSVQPQQATLVMHQPAANPNTQAFVATGLPAGGVYAWQPRAGNRVRFLNGNNPGNSTNATAETQAPGRTAFGVTYRVHGIDADDSATIDVVGVTLAPSPTAVVLHNGAAPNQVVVTATGVPAGGTLTNWAIANNAIAAFANPPGGNAQVTLNSVAAGTTQVDVDCSYNGQTAHATAPVSVVNVQIQQAGPLYVPKLATGPAGIAISAQGTPAPAPGNGTYAWSLPPGNVVAFRGGPPGNVANITLDETSPGVTALTVDYTYDGVTATDFITIHVVGVAIQIAPSAARLLHAPGAAANSIQLTSQVIPGLGGTYAWTVQNTGIFNFPGGANPGNVANTSVQTVGAGTTQVDLVFTVAGIAMPAATQTIHCVAVTITEAPKVGIMLPPPPPPVVGPPAPAAPAPHRVLHSTGTPAGGNFLWPAIPGPAGVVAFATGAATLSTRAANVNGVAVGTRTLRVNYTQYGVTAQATVAVNVTTYSCSCVNWAPAVAPAPAALGALVPAAWDDCVHGPDQGARERPQSGFIGPAVTRVAQYPHHHGEQCAYCVRNGQRVHHYLAVPPAIASVVGLRNEIRALAMLQGNVHNAVVPCQCPNCYILAHPWLQGLPANSLYTAAGNLAGAPAQGRMIGVVLAHDHAGNAWKLRGVSGAFAGANFVAPRFGTPNAYWSRRLVNPLNMSTASRGNRVLGAPPLDGAGQPMGQYGKCAAAHLLQHALHLRLQVDSMAEIWVGPSNGARNDGQLVASCTACRQYLPYLLCDRGGVARGNPYTAPNVPQVVPNRGF